MDERGYDGVLGDDGGDNTARSSSSPDDAKGSVAANASLSEYRALRDEINMRIGAQGRLVALNLTALSAIAGLIVFKNADASLLLLVPFLSVALGFEWMNHMRQLTLIGEYVQNRLWPFLSKISDTTLPNWELEWSRSNPTLAVQILTTLPPAVAFVLPPLLALALSYTSVVGKPLLAAWWADVALCAGLAGLALLFTLLEIRPRWTPDANNVQSWSSLASSMAVRARAVLLTIQRTLAEWIRPRH